MPNSKVSAEEAREKVSKYKDDIKVEGERVVNDVLPQRILEMNELLEQAPFTTTDLRQFHSALQVGVPPPLHADGQPPPGKRRKRSEDAGDGESPPASCLLPHGSVPCNKPITDIIEILKPIIRRIMEETNLLKMWVTYMIPKIEDGNNFGVSIQEDALGEVASAETESATHFYEISRYFSFRAKLVSKVVKYPHIDDYRRAVEELDEKQFVSLRLTLVEIRNRYATLHDVISKNLVKIKKPRSVDSAESMY
ncbi:Proteasome activator complex subunit 3 [Amphibalanus amphitrite]|uniref:Proteasome activator complex subunit 3 n=2 Tax=Amphibalanus amphitrite TaxID=1232801 RepID=A0A6A4WJT5_AMPAM|nr:proteasome activator complex subunit 3-like isoform X2 [Amphibalanus amphitrite]XP_043226883.1 proteasome activator complex subunit 3-like isoform X2 [Amphibalanus amphitrite]XP_043226884.1 proteasome activator complex subunit 3-like isoform X2 [Amphibalanus amphitrite]XP_043226885.1 proteasome activator complex subunit 3-like isoform X2 [Amphibalanus amphitrite]XP_043226886.1 proteasome activator complex subunit 3-like isoform X2 [Amphibalanus amphitrite]XP_043226887.1 proteasome activator